MATNLFANQLNSKVAITTKTWAALGFNSTTITIVYLLDPSNTSKPIATWKPGDPFSTLTGIEAGKGYIIQPKINFDLSLDLCSPFPVTTTTTTSSTTSTTSSTTTTSTTYNQGATFRYASSIDAANIPNANVGDYLLTGPNLTNGETSIDIRPNFNNGFTLVGCQKVLIKAGTYDRISINIPGLTGTQSCPIVITNYGGQVKCRQFIIQGVSYFKITSRYDPANKTGDVNFQGHATGLAFSSGKYGFWIQNQWQDIEAFMLGIAGSDPNQATNWEVEYMEISDGGFSNVFKWDSQGAPMSDCSIHDLYIHDQHGEGVYVGSTGSGTQNQFINLHFYNNRVLRVGNEGLQLGQLREGCLIENNVVHGAINWKSPFGEYQDNGIQFGFRNGGVTFRKNVVINGGEKWINSFTNLLTGITPSGSIVIDNNVFLYCHGPLGAYFGQSGFIPNVDFKITNNYFGKCKFDYDEIYTDSRAVNAPHLLRIANDAAFLLQNNTWDGTDGRSSFYFVVSGDNHPVVTETGTQLRTIPDIEFINYMGFPAGFNYTTHEQWASLVGLTWGNEDQFGYAGTKKGQPVTYIAGDYVTHKSKLYKALLNNSGIEPGVTTNWATYWSLTTYTKPDTSTTTTPPDDVRLVANSYYNATGAGLTSNPAYTGTTTTTTSTSSSTSTTSTSSTSTSSTTTTTTTAIPLVNKLAISATSNTNSFNLKWENLRSELTTNPLFVGIGSSSLAGTGASTYANSFGGLFQSQLVSIATGLPTFANNAFSGTDTTNGLPNGTSASVLENRNISMALAANPSGLVIAYPTNDIINGLTPTQFRNNIVMIYNLARARNIPTFVISVQPRTSATTGQQALLVQAYNMIKSSIPTESFVDVFNLLRDTGSSNPADINPLYNSDGIHVNDAGHQIIYNALWNAVNAFFVDPTYTQYLIQYAAVGGYGDVPNTWSTFDTISSAPTTVTKTYSRVDGAWKAYRVRATKTDTSLTTFSDPIYIYQPVYAGTTVEQILQCDFSLDTVAAPPADWNNITAPAAGPTLNQSYALIDSNSAGTTASLSVTKLFNGALTGGANSGVYPQRVMQDNWFLASSAATRGQVKLSGLSTTNVYDLEFTSSRATTATDRVLAVSVTDSTLLDKTGYQRSVSASDVANQTGIFTLKGIYSTTGEIYVDVYSCGPNSYFTSLIARRIANAPAGITTTTTTTSTSSTTTTSTTNANTNPPFFTTVSSWNAYVKLPDDYQTQPNKYYPTIIFFPGVDEVGSDGTKLLVNGPGKFINQGWSGVVDIDGTPVQPIHISLQPATAYPPETSIDIRINALKAAYRIDGSHMHLTGLSHGGWCAETYVTGDPLGGPYVYAPKVTSLVAVQAVRPDDNQPYPDLFDNFALTSGRWLGFEQNQDGRDMATIATRMNATVASSAIYKQTAFCNDDGSGCGSHCCWDKFYSPSAVFAGLDGRTESIYQWMLRQSKTVTTTTTTTTSTSSTSSTTTTSTTSGGSTTTTTTTTQAPGQFNFNATAQSVSGWIDVTGNASTGTPSGTSNGITVTAVGTSTKWGQQSGTCATNTGGQTTGANTGMCPDNVLTSYFYNNGNTLTPVDDNIEISGLTVGATYKVEVFGSRGATPTRITAYKLRDNAGSELDDNFDVGNNTSVIKTFNGKIADGSGKLYLTIKMPSTGNTTNGNMYGYLNGLRVTRTS